MRHITNRQFYQSSLEKYGVDVRALHWNSIKSQESRFDVLLELIPEDIESLSIADAGCGFGDLYCYMKQKPKLYIGLEIMPKMINEARIRTECEVLHVNILKDTLPKADYYICSGAMNILSRFDTHLFIRRSLEHSKKGFVFNILMGEDDSMVYNYFQKDEIRSMAKKLGLTCKIISGYLERDMSVGFYK
ncbi:MAG: class I SAM-dependent methyltransferase [Campylobacterota bacterium]|nr:class I SAM-dependent methyltransferase [Campylobacterota bacterium]